MKTHGASIIPAVSPVTYIWSKEMLISVWPPLKARTATPFGHQTETAIIIWANRMARSMYITQRLTVAVPNWPTSREIPYVISPFLTMAYCLMPTMVNFTHKHQEENPLRWMCVLWLIWIPIKLFVVSALVEPPMWPFRPMAKKLPLSWMAMYMSPQWTSIPPNR